MKKNKIKIAYSFIIIALLSGCSILNEIVPASKKISGEWTLQDSGGGSYENSPKNHKYTFKISGTNKEVSIDLASTVDLHVYFYNALGQRIEWNSYGKGNHSITLNNLNEGTYSFVVSTTKRNDIGEYSVSLTGISDLKRVEFDVLRINDGDWGVDGGAGFYVSNKNHFYTFDVTTDDSFIDWEIASPSTNLVCILYNQLGQVIDREWGDRYHFIINKATKGTYTLMIGTNTRDSKGTYQFNVYGNVSNLKRIISQQGTLSDTWKNMEKHTYSLNISEDKSIIDVTLRSFDANCFLELYNPLGQRIDYAWGDRYEFLIKEVNKGNYKIIIYPYDNTIPTNAKYTLSVYGKFTDLKKL